MFEISDLLLPTLSYFFLSLFSQAWGLPVLTSFNGYSTFVEFIVTIIILWHFSALFPESSTLNQGSSLRHPDFIDRSACVEGRTRQNE